jgi:hypothetical protein
MASRIVSPIWGIDTSRAIVKNNPTADFYAHNIVETDETWTPLILSQCGFFKSNGEVKKNRGDLWRDLVDGETIKLKWGDITIYRYQDLSDGSPWVSFVRRTINSEIIQG